MYGKTYNLCSSRALAPAEALIVSSSPAFDRLHDDIKIFVLACFYRKLLKKRRPHGEREPTIAGYNTQYFDIYTMPRLTFSLASC